MENIETGVRPFALRPPLISWSESRGELKIAEVTSRFTSVEEFQNLVGSIGFRFKDKA
jgi:hypothetical protein